ncbi:MAG TPA: phosphatidylserine decarboxylase [Thermoanaerobaculia bacterium]|nr:phosphatidylserine decarboxylase [Thermoanaerobaculia bacterium]
MRVVCAAAAIAFAVGFSKTAPGTAAAGRSSTHQPIVAELIRLLDSRPDLRQALAAGIRKAGLAGLATPEDFFADVDEMATWIPVEREMAPRGLRFFYVIDEAPNDALNQDREFTAWMGNFARVLGSFLDTPASAAGIATFAANPDYHVDDYIRGPSGWMTFNQFFAREVRPGRRPISAPGDDRVIVSPADSVFLGQWPIAPDSTVTVKGVKWSIAELLAGSPYAPAFRNGVYTHSFLNINDYHRYHLPVGGVVKEVRNIHGRYALDVVRNAAGELDVRAGDTFQFNQERGLVVVDSPTAGLVAIVPVGMAVISSVNLTPKVGDALRKGDPFGYFLFGGSDIVTLFQNRVVLDARVGQKYLQGERIGSIGSPSR